MSGLLNQKNRRITFAILKLRISKWLWGIAVAVVGSVYLVAMVAISREFGTNLTLGLNALVFFGLACFYFIAGD